MKTQKEIPPLAFTPSQSFIGRYQRLIVIPSYLWGSRGENQMRVWMSEM